MTLERRLLVLYGSETGTAQEVAERVAREGRRRLFRVRVAAMDEYDRVYLVEEPMVVFVCSTTGQGVEPANMTRFWKFLLRKSHAPTVLAGVNFAVFGLGDSSYIKFNFPAKKLQKRLVQLGAEPLVPRGDGDDQHEWGFDGGLDPWLEQLWPAVLKRWPVPPGTEILGDDVLPEPSYAVEFIPQDGERETVDLTTEVEGQDAKHRSGMTVEQLATVTDNSRMTIESHFQDVRHFEFEVPPNTIYAPGDVMVIRPSNTDADVQLVIDHFEWQDLADRPFQLKPNHSDSHLPPHYPPHMTLRHLLTHHLDIFGRPRRYFFHLLSFFAQDPLHSEKLREFASPQGQDDLYAYTHRPRRTTFEVLQDFVSVKIPIKYIIDLIPELRPRSFSIATAPNDAGKVELCVAVVQYKTKLKAPRRGVCTTWMKGLKKGDKVRFWIKPGTLNIPKVLPVPEDIDNTEAPENPPLVLIGPGTGIAPMRSVVLDRIHRKVYNVPTDTILFTGNRYPDRDYLYGTELSALAAAKKLILHSAFSRVDPDAPTKTYVTHLLVKHSRDVYEAIVEKGGKVLVCGNAGTLPKGVRASLAEILQKEGAKTSDEAVKLVAEWEHNGTLQMECWS
ncbi:hypothetical protein DFS34DRAFT_681162 [Phlyctochytrium arcticum]|nr:hypothetical protein DFS34DRAFT_681162 [Phlyctochytrium arcticum]